VVKGNYTRTESSARKPDEFKVWESCTIAVGFGGFCDAPVPQGAPISVCGRHLIKAYKFCEDALDIAAGDTSRPSRSDRYLRFEAWDRRVTREPEPMVVYYALIWDVVKIGVTARLKDRMTQLKVDALLAVERGGWELEYARHEQFEHLRAPIPRHRELFMLGDDLVEHIEALRAAEMASAQSGT